MKGRTPTAEEKAWMNAIADMGCVICSNEWEIFTPAEIHHIDGKTKPGAHLYSIPLCYKHHREGSDNSTYTSRHPHKFRFEQRYGSEANLHEGVYEQLNR